MKEVFVPLPGFQPTYQDQTMENAEHLSRATQGNLTGAGIPECDRAEIVFTWIIGSSIAFCYVASLYIHPLGAKLIAFPSRNRDDPAEIRSRFQRVFCASVISCCLSAVFHYFSGVCSDKSFVVCFANRIGLRFNGVLFASVLPVILTLILFAGPIVGDFFAGRWRGYNRAFLTLIYRNLYYRRRVLRDTIYSHIWWRAYVVAPLSEEFVYRACLIPVLIVCYGPRAAILISPLSFGVAHLHHIFDRIRLGTPALRAVIATLFQIAYTSLFGLYSAYLFVRTGHIAAPILTHALCNVLGVPEIETFGTVPLGAKIVMVVAYLGGFGIWLYLLQPLTDPGLYGNVQW
ncbi:CAAX prenyl protease 2-like [Paramacrobiotus metropolitanus]|uniref:CAAX prenyl protease 2-like n=1 Tax=Paramacrobiotus metropolitanus TaxID=2943436 RepID=UPI0024463B8E|nr:CAAX prenyl protease 2-like [Paramacrobiotus metropolitanus]XP_055327625.1 CAAX prenyl protease 2-like [Paramacrobiotus metropolitanus]XP_055327626.1 CAAX prenyl protease 2-like [Paramacrobiotus metropolitanus]